MKMKNTLLNKIKKSKIGLAIVPVRANIVLQNNHVELIHRACKECYKGKLCQTVPDKLKYIMSKVKLAHESVIEHSNVVMLVELSKENLSMLSDIVSASRLFLDFEIETVDNIAYILVGGSIAGYKRLIQRAKNINNPIIAAIIGQLYYLDKEYFYDFIEDGIMEESKFMDSDLVVREESHPYKLDDKFEKSKDIEVLNIDSIVELYANTGGIFEKHRLLKFVSTTIYFKDMSRVITQQLTRHRNAISQKSQRYVDETGAKAVNPIRLNYDEYIKKSIKLGLTEEEAKDKVESLISLFDKNLEEIAAIYDEVRSDNFVNKEDARYLLTNAVHSSLFVTMTGTNAIHFCKMRADLHAQKEIRLYAYPLEDMLEKELGSFIDVESPKEAMYRVLEPEYRVAFYLDEEECTEEKISEKELTLDDVYTDLVKNDQNFSEDENN